jgi:hypothetical protein
MAAITNIATNKFAKYNQHFIARSNFATNKIALCNQYLVARTNIATIRLIVLGSNATKHLAAIFRGYHNECVAIEKYCHSKTPWSYGLITTKFDPLQYIALATYQIWWQ